MNPRASKGFTLLELLIVMVVIAILAAVTYPSYTAYTMKAARRAAQAQMMEISNRQQQYLLANRSYATKAQMETTGFTLPADVNGKYTWDVALNAAGAPPSFTITFTPTVAQAPDGAITLTSDGVKSPADKW